MAITATRIFDFIRNNDEVCILRHEITLPPFSMLRQSLRNIAINLHESGDFEALEISRQIRALLSEWLTTPVKFHHSIIGDMISDLFGDAVEVRKRWGSDIRNYYDSALHASTELSSVKNPVRQKIREIIRDLRLKNHSFRVYCHRKARQHYDSIMEAPKNIPIEETAYLHTIKDYRESKPFDTLLKVGALRSSGWGAAPDAIFTSPRFKNLIQIAWTGCKDEADFGFDPISSQRHQESDNEGSPKTFQVGSRPVKRRYELFFHGNHDDAMNTLLPDVDELDIFRNLKHDKDHRSAVLLQLADSQGILYPPHSQILSYDPNINTKDSIDQRIPGDSLNEGMFLIFPLVDNVDFDGVRAEHGHFSKTWKNRLRQEFLKNADDLILRLRSAGLNLLHLRSAIQHWCSPPSTVIHAPKYAKHFKILLKTLGLTEGVDHKYRSASIPLWQLAWQEIRRSRGEAIQAGVQAQEIIMEELKGTIQKFIIRIQVLASTNDSFNLTIPNDYELHGTVLFFLVNGIEEGFRVPESELKLIRTLIEVDQWRD